jgi:hypothetical protein
MLDELQSIDNNNTWTLTTLPAGHRSIGLKWVYKLKKDENGNVVKHKARLVAKGYVQRAGVDFEEVFAPVARLESVRLILALAAHRGWQVHHMDVKSAFLNGDLEEVVYVSQPPGFIAEGREQDVYKLHKALYGLRQAPRAWNAKLDASLASLGFTRSVMEHGVYARGTGEGLLIVGVYVDDLVITGAKEQEVLGFKEEMKQIFSMSDLGLLRYYLGLEVKQERGRTTITQAAYACKLLDKAGLTGCNPTRTPMETRCQLSKESKEAAVEATLYRSVIGSLRYLVHTHPDISFAVGFLSRFMEAPVADHYAAVKHLLRYIAGTLSYECVPLRRRRVPDRLQRLRPRRRRGHQEEHFWRAVLPWWQPRQLAISEAEGRRNFVVRGRVHRGGDGGLPRHLACASLRRADESSSGADLSVHQQQICDLSLQEPCSPRSQQAHRPSISLHS